MSLFEIKCVVKAAKLADALVKLDGLAIEPPMVTPMRQSTNGKNPSTTELTRSGVRNGVALDLKAWIANNKLKRITGKQVREAMTPLGYQNYYYGIQSLLNEGVLKKAKEYSTYDVVTK